MTSHIIDHGDVTSLTHAHAIAYGGAPSEGGYTQKQTGKYQRRRAAKMADKSKTNKQGAYPDVDIPADIDPKEMCTCCGSR